MRLALVVLVAHLLGTGVARADPAADLVVVWAPDRDRAPLAEASRAAGVALIDRTPDLSTAAPPGPALRRGIDAYEALRLDEAWAILSELRTTIDRAGGRGLDAGALSDLALYRGLVLLQREEPAAAWDELVAALTVAPARTFDPARFGPRALDELERARKAALARPRVALAVTVPAGCALIVDGVAAGDGAPLLAGSHWVHATCADGGRWGARVELADATPLVIAPTRPSPPTDDELLIQARAAGARAVVTVVTGGELATLRLLDAGGRERARRTVALADGDPAIAATLAHLLRPAAAAPSSRRTRWL